MLKPGYKQTDIGVLPEEWEVRVLGDVTVKVGSGITPTGGNKVYQNSGRPFVRSQNVGWGILLLDDIAFISEEIHSTFASSEIREKDVLLNITGASIGRSAMADSSIVNGNVNQHVCIIRPNEKLLNPSYLCSFLLSANGQELIDSFQTGGNRQGLNFEQIKSFVIPLPPPAEQQAIADTLGAVDALLREQRALLAKKRDLKLATQTALLTRARRLPGFSGEWQERTLGNLFSFLSTGNNSRSELTSHGDIAYLHYGDIHTKYHDFINCQTASLPFLSKEKARGLALLQDGDLIVSDASEDYEGVGKSVEVKGLADKKVVAGLHTHLLRGNKNTVVDGFKGYIQAMPKTRQFLQQMATGVTVYGLSKSNIKDAPVELPPPDEQRAIAQLLTSMDAELAALAAQVAKIEALKQGLMQDLLTGTIRLRRAGPLLPSV